VNERLTEHQREALERYLWLVESHGELFSDRLRRPIITDQGFLKKFVEEHNLTLGVLADTPYLWLLNDLVRSQDSSGAALYHPYLRLIAPPEHTGTSGVVALATIRPGNTHEAESIILVDQDRHATGTRELELPRGFGHPGKAPGVHVLDELKKETGYIGEEAQYLGKTFTDSGTTDGSATFFHVPITGRVRQEPEPEEAIYRTVLLAREELWSQITSGTIRDAFTLQALALYEHSLATKDTAAVDRDC
jgi:ADP-ribose pyrophosphatase